MLICILLLYEKKKRKQFVSRLKSLECHYQFEIILTDSFSYHAIFAHAKRFIIIDWTTVFCCCKNTLDSKATNACEPCEPEFKRIPVLINIIKHFVFHCYLVKHFIWFKFIHKICIIKTEKRNIDTCYSPFRL